MAFIVIGVDVGDDEGHVMHMVVGHRLPHAANHARQHQAFVITELAECFPACLERGQDRGVARDLRVVHRQLQSGLSGTDGGIKDPEASRSPLVSLRRASRSSCVMNRESVRG